MFIADVQKNMIRITQTEYVTSGSRNVYVVHFNLSEEWDALEATAVFRSGNTIINVLLDEERECMIPWEVMVTPELDLYCGVFGTMEGNVVLPTIWGKMVIILEGVTTGLAESPPTPDVYQQILARLRKMQNAIDNGIPYALEAFIDTDVTSNAQLVELGVEPPANFIMLNSAFVSSAPQTRAAIEPEEVKRIHYNDDVVWVRRVEKTDETNTVTEAYLELIDYEGYVYHLHYDPTTDEQIFTKMELVRTTKGEKGDTGEGVLTYNSMIITEPTVGATTEVLDSGFNRTPHFGDIFMVVAKREANGAFTYIATCRVESIVGTTLTLKILAISDITGYAGPEHLWMRRQQAEEPELGVQVQIERNDFNREPRAGDIFDGFIMTTRDDNDFICLVKGTVDNYTVETGKVTVAYSSSFNFFGRKGDKGDTGNEALALKNTVLDTDDTSILLNIRTFNRDPVVGDSFMSFNKKTKSVDLCVVTSVNVDAVIGQVVSRVSVEGPKGETGEQHLWYSESLDSIEGDTVLTDRAYFNRDPIVGESFNGIITPMPVNGNRAIGNLETTSKLFIYYITGTIDSYDSETGAVTYSIADTYNFFGTQGIRGEVGPMALWLQEVSTAPYVAGGDASISVNWFNRMPVTGETFTGVRIKPDGTAVAYLTGMIRNIASNDNGTFANLTFNTLTELVGPQGEKGDTGVMALTIARGQEAIPEVGDRYIADLSDFSRTPTQGETFSGTIYSTSTMKFICYVQGTVNSINDDQVAITISHVYDYMGRVTGAIDEDRAQQLIDESLANFNGGWTKYVLVATKDTTGSDITVDLPAKKFKSGIATRLELNKFNKLVSVGRTDWCTPIKVDVDDEGYFTKLHFGDWPGDGIDGTNVLEAQGHFFLSGADGGLTVIPNLDPKYFTEIAIRNEAHWNALVSNSHAPSQAQVDLLVKSRLADRGSFDVATSEFVRDDATGKYVYNSATLMSLNSFYPNQTFYPKSGTYILKVSIKDDPDTPIPEGFFTSAQMIMVDGTSTGVKIISESVVGISVITFTVEWIFVHQKTEMTEGADCPIILNRASGSSGWDVHTIAVPNAEWEAGASSDSDNTGYTWTLNLQPYGIASALIVVTKKGFNPITDPEVWNKGWGITYTTGEGETLLNDITFKSTKRPTDPYTLYIYGSMSSTGCTVIVNRSTRTDAEINSLIQSKISYPISTENGGTGISASSLNAVLRTAIDSLTAQLQNEFINMRVPFTDHMKSSCEYFTVQDLFTWLTGRTDGATLPAAGTDYTTSRARAISLHTTLPTSGLVNGAIYGIYS